MKRKIIMVGPSSEGLGGISRVVSIWQKTGLFDAHNVVFFSSTSSANVNKILYLIHNYIKYFFELIKGKPFVYVHTSSFMSFYRKSIFILPSLLMRRPVYLHIHPSHFSDFVSNSNGLLKIYIQFILSRVTGFICLSESLKKYLFSLYPDKKIWVLRNPVDMDEMKNLKNHVRKDDRILFLGWFVPAKGVYELVDAIGLLVERGYKIHLDFFGTKDSESLIKYIEMKGLCESIIVHGWIGPDEKNKVLHESTMLVLPSHSEGIPNVILEAMATKTPIVSTLVGGLKEVLRDSENALIARVNDPVDLADKIACYLDNPSLRKQFAETAYQESINKYDINVVKQKFCEIIAEF